MGTLRPGAGQLHAGERIRRLSLLPALVGAGLCLVLAPAQPAEASPTALPRCGAGQVRVQISPGSPGMGQIALIVLVTNTGATACGLAGRPTVGLLSASGAQVATATPSPGVASTARSLRLGAGAVASAALDASDLPPGDATTCPSFAAYTVRLPGWTRAPAFKGPVASCSGVTVTPFVLGRDGLSASGEVTGITPVCAERSRPGVASSLVQVNAWTEGGRLAGSTTVFPGDEGLRFRLALPPGRYRINSPQSPTRRVLVRAGRSHNLGTYGRCSRADPTPSTIPPPGQPQRTTTTAVTGPPAPLSPTSCTDGQLRLALDRVAPAVMQQPAAFFRLTNTSRRACILDGYPSLVPLTASGRVIGAAVRDGGSMLISDPGPTADALRPGDSAFFGYGWSDVSPPLGSPAGCLDATGVLSIAPGTAAPLQAAAALPSVCPDGFPSVTAIGPASAFAAVESPAQP